MKVQQPNDRPERRRTETIGSETPARIATKKKVAPSATKPIAKKPVASRTKPAPVAPPPAAAPDAPDLVPIVRPLEGEARHAEGVPLAKAVKPRKKVPRDPRVERKAASATRCPYCRESCASDGQVKVCRDCLARHHAECWNELGACSSCESTSAIASSNDAAASKPATSVLGVLGTLIGVGSLLLVPLVGLTCVFIAAARAERGLLPLQATWIVWMLSLLPAVAGLMVSLRALLRKDGSSKTFGVVGAGLNGFVLLAAIVASLIASREAPEPRRNVSPRFAMPSPSSSDFEPIHYRRPEPPKVDFGGETLSVSWSPVSAKPAGAADQDVKPAAIFQLAGEPDADWAAQPSGDKVVFGERSSQWKTTTMPVGKGDSETHPIGLLRVFRDSAFDRERACVLEPSRRAVKIFTAGSEGSPKTVEAGAEISDMALAGNRLLCAHQGRPFLTVIDVRKGEVAKEVAIPSGSASCVVVHPKNPRLAVLYAGNEFVGFDAGKMKFLESYRYVGHNLDRAGVQFRMGGDGRYAYGWRTQSSPSGVVVCDGAQRFKETFYEHDDWRMEPDANGRFVFTSNGVYRAGLVERVSEEVYDFLGHLTDGNVLALEHDRRNNRIGSFAVLDARTAQLLKREPLGTKGDGYDFRAVLIPGTNRVLTIGRTSGRNAKAVYSYRDLEPAGAAAKDSKRLQLAAPIPRDAYFGETWTLPIALGKDVPGLKVTVSGPRGMTYDEARKAVVWSPSAIQKGEHAATITISAPGHDDLVLTEKLKADYRILGLTQATDFGVLRSERWIWWAGRNGELTLLDPATKEQKQLSFEGVVDDVAESGDRLYVALGKAGKIVEVDARSLAPLREYKHKFPKVISIAANPDGKRLACVSTDPANNSLLVCMLALDGSSGVARPIPDAQGNPMRYDPFYDREDMAHARQTTEVRWLDSERFVLVNAPGDRFRSYDARQQQATSIFTWGAKQIESTGALPDLPTAVLASKKLVFTANGVLDEKGTQLKMHENSALLPSPDGAFYAAVVLGREEVVNVSFFGIPGFARLDSVAFEFGERGAYRNGFTHAYHLAKTRTILAKTTTTFTEGVQIYFLPYDPSGWSR